MTQANSQIYHSDNKIYMIRKLKSISELLPEDEDAIWRLPMSIERHPAGHNLAQASSIPTGVT